MASSSFMSENQSFSEANSSWASLIVDQVQNSLEDEDYGDILDLDPDIHGRSASVETLGRSKQQVDMRTFEQILQVMIQQGAALDKLREEIDQLRQERRQELEYRDARLRLAEKELRSLRVDKEKTRSELEVLQAEYAALQAAEEEPESSDLLSMEQHTRILLRIKDDARARIENVEAEKSYLTLQLSRLQIQIAQLRNQVDDRSYPEEVIEELTKTLRNTIIETCQNADVEAQEVKQHLVVAQEKLSIRENELEEATSARLDLEKQAEDLQRDLEELHAEYNTVQERLAISESMQGQADETTAALKEVQEQVEQLQEQLSDSQKSRDVALMDCEQLRALLSKAEDTRTELATEAQNTTDALAQAERRLSELQKERDAALSENELLRSATESPESEAALISEVEKLKRDLKDSEEQHERAERISKETENELRIAREKNEELSKTLSEEQENSRAASAHLSELEDEISALKTSHAEEISAKTKATDEASLRAEDLQAKLDDERQKTDALRVELAEISKSLLERANTAIAELEAVRASLREADEGRTQVEERLKEISESLQTAQKERSELESQVNALRDELESSAKRHNEAESELKSVILSKDAELKDNSGKLQTQIVALSASLSDAQAEVAKAVELREEIARAAGEEKNEHLEEVRRLESELKAAKGGVVESEALVKSIRAEERAQQEQIDDLRESLKEAKRGRSEAMRESERIRLLYAEAEGNRAEADMLNEELERKISELEEEAKKVPSVEADLRNTQAQLAHAMESLNIAKDQSEKDSADMNQMREEIAELRAENEQLTTARRQMAAIYGLSAEPINSPRHTPTRFGPSSPVRRSSQSLSPSTSSVAPQWLEYPPPTKRRRVSKLSTTAGSSPAAAIYLDDTDEHLVAPPSTPTNRNQNSTNGEIPRHIVDIYSSFVKLASWNDDEGRPVCGFCALHNHHHEKDRRSPLNFDPSSYPITFWNHCLMRHRNALRPDIESWLKEEGIKLSASETFSSVDLPAVLANFVSWKISEAKYACGLCELEKRRGNREYLDFNPCTEPNLFWDHCHREHVRFWKPVS